MTSASQLFLQRQTLLTADMDKKRIIAILAIILIAVVFKFLGSTDVVTVENDITRATLASQSALSEKTDSEKETHSSVSQPENGSPFKYYYARLNENEQKAYSNVLEKIYDMPDRIRVPSLDQGELNHIFEALLYDNPDLFFVGSKVKASSVGSLAYCTFNYRMSKDEYKKALTQIEEERKKILSSLTNPDDEWQSELEIHDALVGKLEYQFSESENVYSTIYGALVKGTASCEGYSKAMKYVLDGAGIESCVLSGDGTDSSGNTEAHMWNVVRVNGYYCHLDLTWDDPVNGSFLTHSYFNLSDDEINIDHHSWKFAYDCTTALQSYAFVHGLYFSSFGKANLEELSKAFAYELEDGATGIELKFSDATAYSAAYNTLIKNEGIYEVLVRASLHCDVKFAKTSISFLENEENLSMTFIPTLK